MRVTHSVETTDERKARLERIKTVSQTPGVQRQAFETVKFEGDYAVAIRYGNSIAAVTGDGELYEPKDKETEEGEFVRAERVTPGVNPKNRSYELGAAPSNKMIGDVHIPCGVCAIIAGGGAGKTPIAHALASAGVEKYSVVRLGEPLAGYTSNEQDAAFGLAQALVENSDVVLDSIKDALAMGGNAMKSGISRDVLTLISSWSTIACEAGVTIYIPINPSSKDPEVVEMLNEIGRSNATMTIAKTGEMWEFTSRQGEGLQRAEGEMKVDYDEDGTAIVRFKSSNKSSAGEITNRVLNASLNYDMMDRAVRRSLSIDLHDDIN
jgi:hypothetical protein